MNIAVWNGDGLLVSESIKRTQGSFLPATESLRNRSPCHGRIV
jgi:hypothetical protein